MVRMGMAIVLAAGILVGLGAGRGEAAQPTVANGDFEKWADAVPVGWKGVGLSKTDKARNGSAALRVSALKQGQHYSAHAVQAAPMTLKVGQLYVVTLWVKGTGTLHISLGKRASENSELSDNWTSWRLFYPVVDAAAARVSLRLDLSGKDTAADFDDVSIRPVGPIQQRGPNLMPNGDMEADTDQDGCADGWKASFPVGHDAVHLARGAAGGRATVGICANESSMKPTPPDMTTWWDWSKQPPAPDGWVSAVESSNVPVDSGRTYEVRFQTRGQGVRKFHTKMRWLDAEGENVFWFVMGPQHEGNWDWEETTIRLQVPSDRVRFARVEFWSLAAGGKLWVDDVSIRPTSQAKQGYRGRVYQVKPLKIVGQLPKEGKSAVATRKGQPASVTPRPKSTVTVEADRIRIALSSGVDLEMKLAGKDLVGVGAVRLGTLPLRNPKAPPIAPLVRLAGKANYKTCRYVSHAIAADGTVTIHSILTTGAGGQDKLDWVFRPVQRTIAQRPYVGFAYGYVLTSGQETILEVADRATWELGGDPVGLTVVTQDAYNLENTFTIQADTVYAGRGGARFAGADGFDYQFAPEGALAIFYDERIHSVRTAKRATIQWLSYLDRIPQPAVKTVRTPIKCVLYGATGNHDEWTRVLDALYNQHAAYWGIKQHTPLPIINCWMTGYRSQQGPDSLAHLIKDVPAVAKLGFKVFALHSPWGDWGPCALDVIEPSKKFGGVEPIKKICDAAAQHGMIVQAWAPAAHMWKDSPLWKKIPGMKIEGPDGKLPTLYCASDLRGCRFRGGWMDYAVGQWKMIREQTGLASLWVDSYPNFTHTIECADPKVADEQAEDVFRFHAKLCELGYIVYTEATGTFGIVAPGFPLGNIDTPRPVAPDPRTRYGTSGRNSQVLDERHRAINRLLTGGDYYYRSLANKAPFWFAWITLKETPEVHAKITRANLDYLAVVGKMVYRRTLGEDRGVEWTNPTDATRVLFSHKKAPYTCPGITGVLDVTAGKPAALTDGTFTAQPAHTYRITVK